MSNIAIGVKYYRVLENDKIQNCRIIAVNNDQIVTVKFDDGTKKKIKYSELVKYFLKIREDGYLIFSTVAINNDKSNTLYDVLVSLYDSKECAINGKGNINIPKVICRQNISDIFTNMVNTTGINYMGCSVSRDNVPEDIPFEGLLMCDRIEHSDSVAVYLTDTLDDILECVKQKRYDQALEGLFLESIKPFKEYEKKLIIKDGCNSGYVRTLKDLLTINRFSTDFDAAFGVIKINFEISRFTNELTPYQLLSLSEIFNCNFETYKIIMYDNDIELGKINKGRYILLRDITNKVFIMSYTADIEINPLNISYDKLYKDGIGNIKKKTNI